MALSRVKMSKDGLEVSRFVAGFWRQNAWNYTNTELQAYIESLIELGVTTVDHAFVYRSEAQFGEVLKAEPSLRSKMEIVSKFGIRPVGFGPLGAETTNHYDSSPEYMLRSVEQTLSDLNTDYLDVLLVHRPDYLMGADELAEGFRRLKADGKVRYFGVSNFTTSQFRLLQSACDDALVTNQIEFSPLHLSPLEDGVLDQCQEYGIRPMLWSCLGGGRILTGNEERDVRVRNTLRLIADELAAESIEQVVYAWALRHPSGALPILGSSKIERIKSAVAAESLSLTRENWYAIWEASTGYRVP